MKMPSSVTSPASRRPSPNAVSGRVQLAGATRADHRREQLDRRSERRALAGGAPPGVDPSKYTVFFINWYGRPDFKYHVYTKTDEPDPDTGYNFGLLRQSRKMIAWGGTAADDAEGGPSATARVWFYDLSAGPEFWTDNWDITTADLDGDGALDYRMPPVWEYGNPKAGLYRSSTIFRGISASSPVCGHRPVVHDLAALQADDFTACRAWRHQRRFQPLPGRSCVRRALASQHHLLQGQVETSAAGQSVHDRCHQSAVHEQGGFHLQVLPGRCVLLWQQAVRHRVRRPVPLSRRPSEPVHRRGRWLRSARVPTTRPMR